MDESSLRLQMDLYRKSSVDRQAPEFAELTERLDRDPAAQQLQNRVAALDGRILHAMHQAPVPAGLAARVLERLHQVNDGADQAVDTAPATIPIGQAAATAPAANAGAATLLRRRWIALFAAAAASVMLAAGAWSFWSTPGEEPLTVHNIAERARSWNERLATEDAPPMSNSDSEQFPWHYRLRHGVALGASYDATEIVGLEAASYELTSPDQSRARLFVFRAGWRDLDSIPPQVPPPTSGGQAVAFWRSPSNGLVYVLVVERAEDYQQFVDTTLPEFA